MIEEYKRSCKFTALKPFDYFAKEEHFMELSEWYNGEGFDLHVESSNGAQRLSLTWGEWKAMQALVGNDEDDEEED